MVGFTTRVGIVILFNYLFQVNKCPEVCAVWLKHRLAQQTIWFLKIFKLTTKDFRIKATLKHGELLLDSVSALNS